MGGLAFDMTKDTQRIWPTHIDRMALTPDLIIACAQNGLEEEIPVITEGDIRDKSKADDFAKGFVCIQALWFCAQVLTRILQQLPVSLLELNTFAHCLCAFLIYCFWWSKPLDITEPATIPTQQSERTRCLCARASFHSDLESYFSVPLNVVRSRPKDVGERRIPTWAKNFCRKNYAKRWCKHALSRDTDDKIFKVRKPEDGEIYEGESADYMNAQNRGTAWRLSTSFFQEIDVISAKSAFASAVDDQADFEFTSSSPFAFILKPGRAVPGTLLYNSDCGSCEIDDIALRRLTLASRPDFDFLTQYRLDEQRGYCPMLVQRMSDSCFTTHYAHRRRFSSSSERQGAAASGATLKAEETDDSLLNTPQCIAMILAGLCYGGIQALAIGVPLHSDLEGGLWIASCAIVVGLGVLISLFNTIGVLSLICDLWDGRLIGLMIIIYAVARIFLLVEVFYNVPYVDPAVFLTPNWSLYLPHVT